MVRVAPAFASVPETENDFLALFPHRFDYIWAPYPDSGQAVEWRTESRHPLSDRVIQQATYLYGVRFGAQTQYALLDIDAGSLYHPQEDPLAISRMLAALEPVGLQAFVACTSSYSGGLHLYFPFAQPQSSWKLAIAISTLLENAGFKLRPGQLEVFPDPKPYGINGQFSLFNAHRLPLQIGSYLVDQDFQPRWGHQSNFVQAWCFAQAQNMLNSDTITSILKQIKRNRYFVSTKADKFINDLNAEIEVGWTGYGQTNYLLGRITMREYIFRHVLSGGNPLEGSALVAAVVDIAQALPGYQEWCRHRHEIHHRATEWVRCIEQSHYFHYGDAAGKFKSKAVDSPIQNVDLEQAIAHTPSWNQQQAATARDRIRAAIATLLEQGTLPATATARFHALVQCGIGGSTLYRHRDLWHPNHLQDPIPPHPPVFNPDVTWDCDQSASHAQHPSSLFHCSGRNPLPDELSGDREPHPDQPGRNSAPCSPLMAVFEPLQSPPIDSHRASQTIATRQQQQQAQWEARQKSRMQQFLASGDPILVAEARNWARANPGVLAQHCPEGSAIATVTQGEPVITTELPMLSSSVPKTTPPSAPGTNSIASTL
jgi:hypothetical protein